MHPSLIIPALVHPCSRLFFNPSPHVSLSIQCLPLLHCLARVHFALAFSSVDGCLSICPLRSGSLRPSLLLVVARCGGFSLSVPNMSLWIGATPAFLPTQPKEEKLRKKYGTVRITKWRLGEEKKQKQKKSKEKKTTKESESNHDTKTTHNHNYNTVNHYQGTEYNQCYNNTHTSRRGECEIVELGLVERIH